MHELDNIDDQKRNALQYRFAGYQLPKIILDETGQAYIVLSPHPYYRNQPLYWQKIAYTGSDLPATGVIEPEPSIIGGGGGRTISENSGGESSGEIETVNNNFSSYTEGLIALLPFK